MGEIQRDIVAGANLHADEATFWEGGLQAAPIGILLLGKVVVRVEGLERFLDVVDELLAHALLLDEVVFVLVLTRHRILPH